MSANQTNDYLPIKPFADRDNNDKVRMKDANDRYEMLYNRATFIAWLAMAQIVPVITNNGDGTFTVNTLGDATGPFDYLWTVEGYVTKTGVATGSATGLTTATITLVTGEVDTIGLLRCKVTDTISGRIEYAYSFFYITGGLLA